jgi:hypothetical protein
VPPFVSRKTKQVKTLGVFVRIQNGAYVAGFAVVDGDRLLSDDRFPAPPDEDETRQLWELYRHTRDAIAQLGAEAVALKDSEIQGGGRNAKLAHRAEGALLAATGEIRELEVTTWLGVRMWKPAGFGARPGSNAEIFAALCAQLDQQPASTETQQAAAAARAANITRK